MSDNPPYGTHVAFDLPGIRLLALTGCDAVAFAQSQFMNDVAALGDGEWQWSGWLDPKGRVQALFALARLDAETLWLLTTSDVQALGGALRRFVFRSKVSISTPELAMSGRLSRPALAHGRSFARTETGFEFDFSGAAGDRALCLGPVARTSGGAAAWWALDVAHGWPALPGIALDAWTPQQLSLQRLNAFSVKKGCYPGQEIVARTHFLGRVKRGLVRLKVPAAAPGAAIVDASGRQVGEIVCVAGNEALAVVPLEPADLALVYDGLPVERLALAGGLER